MENWKRFLSEGASEPERAAALIWNDSTYRPLDDEGLSKIFSSESEIGQFISEVPQGHAGIVLIKEIKNPNTKFKTFCVSIDFAPRDYCSKKDEDFLKSIRQKFGLFVNGQVLVRRFSKKYNFFDDIDEYIPDVLMSNYTKIKRMANQVGYAPDINFEAALQFAKSQNCRLYTVVPHLFGSKGDNCGSLALKVAAAGLGESSESIVENMIGPDEMLSKMLDLNWIEFAKSVQPKYSEFKEELSEPRPVL